MNKVSIDADTCSFIDDGKEGNKHVPLMALAFSSPRPLRKKQQLCYLVTVTIVL